MPFLSTIYGLIFICGPRTIFVKLENKWKGKFRSTKNVYVYII